MSSSVHTCEVGELDSLRGSWSALIPSILGLMTWAEDEAESSSTVVAAFACC